MVFLNVKVVLLGGFFFCWMFLGYFGSGNLGWFDGSDGLL